MRFLSLAAAFVMMGATSTRSEIIEDHAPFYFDSNEPTSAMLVGSIDPRTPLAFSRLIEAQPTIDTLLISSPGGSVYAAILIAREVDRRGLTTIIPENQDCVSACSFIYFAGHERIAHGRLGVHQISSEDPDLVSAQLAVSDISELLYEFAVPNEIFLLMMRTPPDSMHMLDPSDLKRLGLVGSRKTKANLTKPKADSHEQTTADDHAVTHDLSLADGTYSNAELKVVVDGAIAGITYTGRGCIGAMDAEIREQAGRVTFVADGCTIEVTKLGPFDFSLDQGPGCSMYHGTSCSLSGYVRRSN